MSNTSTPQTVHYVVHHSNDSIDAIGAGRTIDEATLAARVQLGDDMPSVCIDQPDHPFYEFWLDLTNTTEQIDSPMMHDPYMLGCIRRCSKALYETIDQHGAHGIKFVIKLDNSLDLAS